MLERDKLWLWLTQIRGIGQVSLRKLLTYYTDIEELLTCTDKELKEIGIKERQRHQLLKGPDTKKLDEKLITYHQKGIKFVTIADPLYPQYLKNIYDPPYVLYYRGHLQADEVSIGVVGARRCTEYGKKVAYDVSKSLADQGVVIISGMARGIDSYAHEGALVSEGRTYAILGCGVDICYPKENSTLMENIIANGAVISEYPPGTEPKPGFFPLRNRIISGMSKALLVVEAAKRSGSLITADQALEQGKDVYAVPGSIYSTLSKGTHDLIQQGASILTSTNQLLEDLGLTQKGSSNFNQTKLQIILEKEEKMIYDSLGLEPLHTSAICSKVGLSVEKVQSLLTIMEVRGYIQGLHGKGFIKKM